MINPFRGWVDYIVYTDNVMESIFFQNAHQLIQSSRFKYVCLLTKRSSLSNLNDFMVQGLTHGLFVWTHPLLRIYVET
jgi:hypothetical protein